MFINTQKGFTIIEVIIYLALFAFIIGAGVSASYYLIDASAKGKAEVNTMAEAEFMLRKIDWAMTGLVFPFDSVDPVNMEIVKGGVETKFSLDSDRTQITVGGDTSYLTSERVKVTGLEFIYIPSTPPGITASSTIDGKHFEITKYLRQ